MTFVNVKNNSICNAEEWLTKWNGLVLQYSNILFYCRYLCCGLSNFLKCMSSFHPTLLSSLLSQFHDIWRDAMSQVTFIIQGILLQHLPVQNV